MGVRTACITLRADRIGHMPCNCSIGGPAKGHLAREVDALGGQMAVTTDLALTHIRVVGTGKGPAVQTFRAHACKSLYPQLMGEVMRSQAGLTIIEGAVETVITEDGKAVGVRLENGDEIASRAIVLTTGTFLNGVCHRGEEKFEAARHGDRAVQSLSGFLQALKCAPFVRVPTYVRFRHTRMFEESKLSSPFIFGQLDRFDFALVIQNYISLRKSGLL
jgi:tRNA uridine 5-carboxymethylaminomethyl modification enzyme